MAILDSPLCQGFKKKAGTSGGEWAGPCPECGGEDCFLVWPDHPGGRGKGGRFMCRKCEKTGDGIQFLRDFAGMTYHEACKALQIVPKGKRRVAPTRTVREAWKPKPVSLPGDPWQAAAARFARGCIGFLTWNREGQEYVASRGLAPGTCQRLGVGWNLVDRREPLSVWGLPEEVNPETGRPRTVWLPAGLVVPTTRNDVVTAIKIRRTGWTPEDPLPKYWAVRGGSQSPFILDSEPGKPVVVVESELDAVLISQEAGDLVTAVALGTARGKPDEATTTILRAAPVILVALDFDDAGKAAWPWWKETFLASVLWPVPVGKDVGDLLGTPGLIRAWIEKGLPSIESPAVITH